MAYLDPVSNPESKATKVQMVKVPLQISFKHSHIAIVVTPPSLKSFANQKNLSNHRVVIQKNPLQITSDHFRMTTL